MWWRRACAITWVSLLTAGCLTPTPFGGTPEESELNSKSIARLAKAGSDGRPLHFTAFGDTGPEYDDLKRTVASINAVADLDFALHLGDQTEIGLLQEYEWERSVLRNVNVPTIFTVGDRDLLSGGENIYKKMYGPLRYSFEMHGVRFVSFDSSQAIDADWLEERIVRAPTELKVVLLTHEGPEANGALREAYRRMHESGRVMLWVYGHADAFTWQRAREVPMLSAGPYSETREHAEVTYDGRQLQVKKCRYDDCVAMDLAGGAEN